MSNIIIEKVSSIVNDIQQFETSLNDIFASDQVTNQVLFKLNKIKIL